MSDEHWRAQSTPEAIQARESARIQEAARTRGQWMPAREASEAARRVIEEREAFDRLLRDRAEATGRENAAATRDRTPAIPAGQMAARRPWESPVRGLSRLPRTRRSR